MMRSPALNSTLIGPDCRKRARASRAEQSCRTKAFMTPVSIWLSIRTLSHCLFDARGRPTDQALQHATNSSRKLPKNPLAWRNTSLSNKFILHRDTCCRHHFHRGFALDTTRSHDQRQIMLEHAAVPFAPAFLLGSLNTSRPQVNPMCGELPVQTFLGYALHGHM